MTDNYNYPSWKAKKTTCSDINTKNMMKYVYLSFSHYFIWPQYSALTALDLLAWGAGTGYKIYQVIPLVKSDVSATGILQHTSLLSLHLFVGILLVCIAIHLWFYANCCKACLFGGWIGCYWQRLSTNLFPSHWHRYSPSCSEETWLLSLETLVRCSICKFQQRVLTLMNYCRASQFLEQLFLWLQLTSTPIWPPWPCSSLLVQACLLFWLAWQSSSIFSTTASPRTYLNPINYPIIELIL